MLISPGTSSGPAATPSTLEVGFDEFFKLLDVFTVTAFLIHLIEILLIQERLPPKPETATEANRPASLQVSELGTFCFRDWTNKHYRNFDFICECSSSDCYVCSGESCPRRATQA